MKAVSRQLPVVSIASGQHAGDWPNRLEVTVQFWTEFVEKGLELLDGLLGKELSAIGAPEPVFRFVQGAAGIPHESLVVSISASSNSLRDVGTNAISRPHDLRADCVPGKVVPPERDVLNGNLQFLQTAGRREDSRSLFS